ncbi:MAG: hypothetical protein ACTSWX_05140 [Promethearchaeota archaeon]
MSTIGPYDKRELADHLLNISDDEMREFHRKRMKKYRYYFIIAILLGIISIVFIFVKPVWVSIVCAVIGIGIVNITGFKRNKWKRLYENLIYLKKERQKTLNEKNKGKRLNKDKFSRLDSKKKTKN